MQQEIASAYEESGGDALYILFGTITGTRRDPIGEWLQSTRTSWSFLDENPELTGTGVFTYRS